jgi:hypothetical protein
MALNKSMSKYFTEMGRKGGRSRSAKKAAACRANVAKAREARQKLAAK